MEIKKLMKLLLIVVGFFFVLLEKLENNDEYPIYLLLDRTSTGIYYHEDLCDSSFIERIFRSWGIKQKEERSLDVSLEEGITFWSNKEKGCADEDKIEKKSILFLDSIRFHNEKWVRDSFTFDSANKVYLLDKATIRGDSIVMYEVQVFQYRTELYYD